MFCKRHVISLFLAIVVLLFPLVIEATGQGYFPPKNVWRSNEPAAAGFDKAKLEAAVSFAVANESKAPRDQQLGQAQTFGREPFGESIGPYKTRGEMTGLIIRRGLLVKSWGEPDRIDMTHSVTKSFLTATVGLAYDRGIIKNLKSPVYKEMAPVLKYEPDRRFGSTDEFGRTGFLELFNTSHNKKIDWDSLLRQTSDWEGVLWGKPDWADRPAKDRKTWLTRKRNAPGTVFEYNDVRVNLLALAALNVIREPLPSYLKKHLMDEIGASDTWRWHGYENSFIVLDGKIVQSVSGGGHWGGGMFINAFDMARLGVLIENEGVWDGKRLLSREFLNLAETPTAARPTYGFMNFFLNTEKGLYPKAPEGTIAFLGNGTNLVYIDKENDLVIVARWINGQKIDEFLSLVYGALKDE